LFTIFKKEYMSLIPSVSKRDNTQGDPTIIELVEYGDFQSNLCGHAYPTVKRIQEKFGDNLMFVFRHFPLNGIHSHAMLAAMAAEAAGKQGKFWPMHDMLFENQEELHLSALNAYAAQIGLDVFQFGKDMEDEKLKIKIEEDFESGLRSDVDGTPTFFINGEKYLGAWDERSLSSFIKNEIAQVVGK
jgi:protein-disulfide isomerase